MASIDSNWERLQATETAARRYFKTQLEPDLIRGNCDRGYCFLHPTTHEYVVAETFVKAAEVFSRLYGEIEPVRCRIGLGPPVEMLGSGVPSKASPS